MWKIIIYFISILTLVSCSAVPGSVIKKNIQEIQYATDFELCRAALDFDISERRLNASPVPAEMLRRELSFDSCFEIALSEYGVKSLCSDFNRAVWRGDASVLIGFGWDMGRDKLGRGLEERHINCFTDDYLAKKVSSPSDALNNASREFRDEMKKLNSKTRTTRCISYYEDSMTCRHY